MAAIKKLILALALLTGTCLGASAQNNLAGMWASAHVNKVWNEHWYNSARFEYRMAAEETECWFLMVGGGYSYKKFFRAELDYEFWQVEPSTTFHKGVLALTGSYRIDNWSFALREKYELSFNPESSPCDNNFRTKFTIGYKVPDSRFKPYMAYELFHFDKWRRMLYYCGTEINISKRSTFDIFYLLNYAKGGDFIHTVGLGYILNL